MKKWILRAAAIFTGLMIGLSACGQREEGTDSGMDTESPGTSVSGSSESETDSPETGGTDEVDGTDAPEEKDWYQQMLEDSVLSIGSNGRLEKVLERMKAGENVSVAFIGGSVTEGALADSFEESYTDCFIAELREEYPDAELNFINAGLSGTGSSLGVMRYEKDVVEQAGGQPDIVFLEFAINDYQEPTDGRAYESMIRTILGAGNDPAVILLFSVSRSEWNMQDTYIPMGKLYGLPMVSIRDAVRKPCGDGTLTKEQFFADEYHPTSYGHKVMADCLGELIQEVEASGSSGEGWTIPEKSIKSPDFVDMHLLTSLGGGSAAVSEGGFTGRDTQVQGFRRRGGESSFPDNWMHTAESGGEAFRAELKCRNIVLNYKLSGSQDFGSVCVYVDGEQVAELDGYAEGGWNNSVQVLVLDEKESGEHVLELRMAEGDEEKCFTLLTIGYSEHEPSGLVKVYEDNFPIGVALPGFVLQNTATYGEAILNNFNSITCENEMKPDFLLDKAASQASLSETNLHAAVRFDNCMPAIEYALENNMKIRFHTLVWHSQTPKWFFTEDYTDNGTPVSRDVMLARMENYIADVLGYFQENYPGLIYAVDVVNEAFDVGDGDENGVRMKNNMWYETVGADYYYQAFVFARKYSSEDMKLFYNDYGCMYKTDLITKRLARAKEEGLIDGIGMQSHLSTGDRIQQFMLAVKIFCQAGYEVQATELDIGMPTNNDSGMFTQARKYMFFFENMKKLQEEGYPITGITVWGLNDKLSWRKDEYALLFDKDMNPKQAYQGAMLDPSIPAVD